MKTTIMYKIYCYDCEFRSSGMPPKVADDKVRKHCSKYPKHVVFVEPYQLKLRAE